MFSVLLTASLSSLGTGPESVDLVGNFQSFEEFWTFLCFVCLFVSYICYYMLDNLCLDVYFHAQAVEEKDLEPLDRKKCHLLW